MIQTMNPKAGFAAHAHAVGPRLYAIDTAKGLGIVLVVFGHAWRGVQGAGLLADGPLFSAVDQMIYAFHMPLFFFLSGLLFLEILQKAEPGSFAVTRAVRLLWPFVLWTWVFFGFKWAAGPIVNEPVVMSDFPLWPFPPYEHLWFLWALWLCQMVAMAGYLVLRPFVQPGHLRTVCAVGAVAMTLLIPLIYIPSVTWGAPAQHFPYFIAGIALGGVAHLRPPVWLVAVAGLAFALLLSLSAHIEAALLVSLALTVLFCVVVAGVDRKGPQAGRFIAMLRYLGGASLVLYLAHTVFSAGTRILLTSGGVTSVPVHLVTEVGVGLAGPIVLLWISRRLGMVKVLGL